jgi:phytoene dehydrogenase-like protein
MAYDWLKGISDHYDVVVIGSGLAGLTGANTLAKCGHKVLLLEHHYQLGGLATWFTRKGGHIFDISLHGFPIGMIKSVRKYWSQNIADSIVQLKGIRFINPQFQIDTTFDREDFTRLLIESFKVPPETVERFFTDLRAMNFYDNNPETTGQMFDRYFPGRDDVKRFLMEPIAYANGSTLDDPAITFGIVFSNFMSKGVYTFRGGSDVLIRKMTEELRKNGVEIRKHVVVEKILTEERDGKKHVTGVIANGRAIRCDAILSNSNIKNTVLRIADQHQFLSGLSRHQKRRIDSPYRRSCFHVRGTDVLQHQAGGSPHDESHLLGLLSRYPAGFRSLHGRLFAQFHLRRLEQSFRGRIYETKGAIDRGIDCRPGKIHSGRSLQTRLD